jgi:hypothetical protein
MADDANVVWDFSHVTLADAGSNSADPLFQLLGAGMESLLPRRLQLGISIEGALQFLKCIGYLVEVKKYENKLHVCPDPRFEYERSYERGKGVKWADEALRPIAHDKNGGIVPESMTGYDLCDYLRTWLRDNGHEGFSVCEVILKDPAFEQLREHVLPANIFYSHIQSLGPLQTFRGMHFAQEDHQFSLPPKGAQYFWLDYFCLRQCQSDFKVEQVIALIKEIALTIAELGGEEESLEYLKRSFCILELYATVVSDAKLLCATELEPHTMRKMLTADPVKSFNAQTRSPTDKTAIDNYITESVGFEKMDAIATERALAGADAYARALDAGMESDEELDSDDDGDDGDDDGNDGDDGDDDGNDGDDDDDDGNDGDDDDDDDNDGDDDDGAAESDNEDEDEDDCDEDDSEDDDESESNGSTYIFETRLDELKTKLMRAERRKEILVEWGADGDAVSKCAERAVEIVRALSLVEAAGAAGVCTGHGV